MRSVAPQRGATSVLTMGLLLLSVAFIAGFATGGAAAERALADARRKLAFQRHLFWQEQQDGMDAEHAAAEIQRLQERVRRLSRQT